MAKSFTFIEELVLLTKQPVSAQHVFNERKAG